MEGRAGTWQTADGSVQSLIGGQHRSALSIPLDENLARDGVGKHLGKRERAPTAASASISATRRHHGRSMSVRQRGRPTARARPARDAAEPRPRMSDEFEAWLAQALQARALQGLGPVVSDPVALKQIAVLLDVPPARQGPSAA